jgi:catecholate siderophore receptor
VSRVATQLSSSEVTRLPTAPHAVVSVRPVMLVVDSDPSSTEQWQQLFGAKFDVRRSLSLTTAVYRLDRTNTRATDPADPGRILQTGSQRTNGGEFGLNGNITNKWRVAGGYAYQDAHVTRATVSAKAGARVAQAPRHSFSLWNSYELLRRVSAGLGILHRSDMFAGIDNTVTLPGYIRADAALFYSITERVRLQANVENALDLRYYINADGNNNISPGSPRALRLGVIASF